MTSLLRALVGMLRSRATLLAENALLRQQVIVLRRGTARHRLKTREGFGTRCLVTPPRAPQANVFCERMIGTLQRDCLDNMIVLDDCHAERILREYLRYYHGRPHRGLRMQAPMGARWLPPVRPAPARAVRSRAVLGGLHHEYTIAA